MKQVYLLQGMVPFRSDNLENSWFPYKLCVFSSKELEKIFHLERSLAPEVIKLFSCFTEHEIYPACDLKCQLLAFQHLYNT